MATRTTRAAIGSIEHNANEAVRLAKDYIHHFWSRDFDWCLSRTARDFVWIGPRKGQYTTSLEEYSEVLSSLGTSMMRSSVTDEEYSIVACDEHMASVVGRCLVLIGPKDDEIVAQWHSCSFVWKRTGRRLLLVHLHISSPDDSVDEGSYPIHSGTETYRYMKSLMKLGSSRKAVSLFDVDGTVHWVHPSQIVYLEASRKRTIVHCMTKDVVVPAVIRDAVEMVGDKILRVHRSYAVNRDHVVELKAGRLLLDDGTSIVIPAKRIADVRAQLTV